MTTNARLWLALAAFQVVFGLGVFAATRAYYLRVSAPSPRAVAAPSQWPDVSLTAPVVATAPGSSSATDPLKVSNDADAAFGAQRYEQAAELYEQLLTLDPSNVDVYNNLGITLHYLGRSEEALRRLDEGIALDPMHQRIWLTTGFVNVQLGNTERARAALTNASTLGSDAAIRESAQEMLAGLR